MTLTSALAGSPGWKKTPADMLQPHPTSSEYLLHVQGATGKYGQKHKVWWQTKQGSEQSQ